MISGATRSPSSHHAPLARLLPQRPTEDSADGKKEGRGITKRTPAYPPRLPPCLLSRLELTHSQNMSLGFRGIRSHPGSARAMLRPEPQFSCPENGEWNWMIGCPQRS